MTPSIQYHQPHQPPPHSNANDNDNHDHYHRHHTTTAISKIVAEEAAKRGVPYAHYGTLPEILAKFVQYMAQVGAAEQEPADPRSAAQLARL